jgi:hypothetical protein
MSTVTTEIIRITPKRARELLEANTVNRRLTEKRMLAMREDMEQGRWLQTGEPIKISRTGDLLDGQHRLQALAKAKVRSIEFLVVYGLNNEAQALMDSGTSRSISNAIELTYGKAQNLAVRAALARWLTLAPEPVPEMHSALKRKVTTAMALETYAANPEIPRAAQAGMHIRQAARLQLSPSALGYSWLHLHRCDTEACERYFAAMETMQFHDGLHDPRLAAWRRLQVLASDSVQGGNQYLAVAIISVITRSWNTWRKGEDLSSISYKNAHGLIGPVRPV